MKGRGVSLMELREMRVGKYIILQKAGQEQAQVLSHSGELLLDAYSFVYILL